MALVPPSSSGPGTTGGTLVPSSSEGQGGSGTAVVALASGVLGTYDVLAAGGLQITYTLAAPSTVWPTASLAILVPFSLPATQTLNRMLWHNGGAVSGNVDAGVYNEDGTKVITTGSVAQTTTGVVQAANVTPTSLLAGSYFMVLCLDNTTGTFARWPSEQRILRGVGVQQAAAAVPLGATLTLANPANAYMPLFACGFVAAT